MLGRECVLGHWPIPLTRPLPWNPFRNSVADKFKGSRMALLVRDRLDLLFRKRERPGPQSNPR